MAFLEYNLENNIAARFKSLKADNIRVYNETSGQYENVLTWSSSPEPITLPYYLKSNNIEMKDESNLAYSLLTKNTLTLSDSVLDGESINASNRVKNIAQDMSPNDKKMVLYDASTKGLTYGNQPTSTVLPTWVTPTAATFSSGTDSTSLESNFFRLNSDTSRTFIDSDNLSFTKNSILNFELRRNGAESDEMQLRWMDSGGNLSSKIGASSILGKSLAIPDASAGVVANNGGVFCGVVNSSGAPVTSTRYTKMAALTFTVKKDSTTESTLGSTYLTLKDNNTSYTLAKETIVAANKIHNISSTSDTTGQSMVTFNPTDSSFKYAPIPSGGGTAAVNYVLNVPVYVDPGSSNTSFFPRFNGDTIGTGMDSVAGSSLRRYKLNVGDSIILKTIGGVPGDTVSFYYDTWYVITLSKDAVNYSGTMVEGCVVRSPTGLFQHSIDIASSPINTATVPLGSVLFRINAVQPAGGSTSKKAKTDAFYGTIKFTVLSYDPLTNPAPVTV